MASTGDSRSGDSMPQPPKPPDEGGQEQPQGVSFRDKVIGRTTPAPTQERRDLISSKLMTML
ncbi:putative Transposon TX1 [Sesbania bispinosa]|nr:putative Transposon TX1 [Sesbania bispinosa]